MNNLPVPLDERRSRLIAQAAAQRVAVAANIEPLRRPFALADKALDAVRYIKRHPVLLVGGVVLFALWRPGGIAAKLQRAFMAWQFVAKLRNR